MPLLDARLAVRAEVHLGNAIASSRSRPRSVESLRAKAALADKLLGSAKRLRSAWTGVTRTGVARARLSRPELAWTVGA
jgi:hypothetical protein